MPLLESVLPASEIGVRNSTGMVFGSTMIRSVYSLVLVLTAAGVLIAFHTRQTYGSLLNDAGLGGRSKLGMETNYSRCSRKRESLRKNPQKFPSLFEREEPLELHTGFRLVTNCAKNTSI